MKSTTACSGTHEPRRPHADLNVVDGSADMLIQVDTEVAGEMIENEIAAVERLQQQDLPDRRFSDDRRCGERQTGDQRGASQSSTGSNVPSHGFHSTRLQGPGPSVPE